MPDDTAAAPVERLLTEYKAEVRQLRATVDDAATRLRRVAETLRVGRSIVRREEATSPPDGSDG